MKYKIFIAEDNQIISDNIAEYLRIEGFLTYQFFSGENIIFEIVDKNPDLIILDLGLPNLDGLTLCKNIREKGFSIPILILTARSTTKDKIIGLEYGADDYLTKPFNYEELLARIRALIRRNFSNKSNIINIGKININVDEKKVEKNKTEIKLSNLEFNLFLYLSQNKGKIISKDELLEKIWGEYDSFSNSRTIDVYVGYLRKKLGKTIIETKRGEGYIIK